MRVAGLLICLLGLGACASTAEVRTDRVLTPSGVVETPCRGVPVAVSRDPDRLAFSCGEDGRLLLLTSEGDLIAETPDALLLESIGIAGAGEHLEAFGFRGALHGEDRPRLKGINLYRGGFRYVPLPSGFADRAIEYAAVEGQGACLLLGRRVHPGVTSWPEMNQFEIAVFPRVSQPGEPTAFGDEPTLTIPADGFMMSGVGRNSAGLVRCLDGETPSPAIVAIHRFQPSRDRIYYEVAVHTAAGRRVVHTNDALLSILNRGRGDEIALIDQQSSRLAILDARAGRFSWVHNREDRLWMGYDLTTGNGVAIRKGDDANAMVSVACDPQGEVCRETVLEPSVSLRLHGAISTAPPGGGHLVLFERKRSATDLDSLGYFDRWVFGQAADLEAPAGR